MTCALFVVSEEGYWVKECIEPLASLDEAGVEITVTTTGRPPVVDERSVAPETVGEELSGRVRQYDENDERLADPAPIATVDSDLRTARGPESSAAATETLLGELGIETTPEADPSRRI